METLIVMHNICVAIYSSFITIARETVNFNRSFSTQV